MSGIESEAVALQKCALDILVGEKIGGGVTRNVYSLRHSPDLVIKVEYASREFCNVAEYELWRCVEGTPLARWFAPVVEIDVWGGTLLMKRTTPITEAEFNRLGSLPKFMHDIKAENFGRLNGKIVCHDYGYHGAIQDEVDACIRQLERRKRKAA